LAVDWWEVYGSNRTNLVLSLPFNEGKGDSSADLVSGQLASVHNASWVAGYDPENKFLLDNKAYESKNYAIGFDGKSSYVEVANTSQLDPANALTVGAWIKPENVTPTQISEQGYIVSKNNGNHSGYVLTTYYQNGLAATLVTDEGEYTVSAANVLRREHWQHVAFSWGNNILQLLVDGEPVGKAVLTKGKLKPFDGPLCIGRAADRDGQYFNGAIDEVKVLNTAFLISASHGTGQEVTLPASNVDDTEIKNPRNHFIIGQTEKRLPLVDFEDLSGWTVSSYQGISEAKLYRSQEHPLWGDYVAKLTLKAGPFDDPDLKKAVIYPPAPITIKDSFDGINIWVFGNYWRSPNGVKISVQIQDADRRIESIPMESSEHPFVFWSGWYLLHRTLPAKISAPAKFLSLTFYDFLGEQPENIYFDSLDFYSIDRKPVPSEVPTWKECGFPTTWDTILPMLPRGVKYTNSVQKTGDVVSLTYKSTDDNIEFRYEPKSGTLSDITAVCNGRPSFQPAAEGGWVLDCDGKEYLPGDTDVKKTLQNLTINGNNLSATWLWQIGKISFTTWMKLSIKQKSLIIDFQSDSKMIKEFRCGSVKNVLNPILTQVPYLSLGESIHKSIDPAILYTNGLFVSSFLDWFNSDASELFGEQRVSGPDSAVINGGSAYFPKTNGERNAPHERLFISISKKFSEVLPNIPNPPNKWLETTRSAVWATRMWYVSKVPYPSYYDEEAAFWEKMRQYGMENLFIRFHGNFYRSYVNFDGGPTTLILDTDPQIGGDAKCVRMIDKLQDELGYRVGFYTDYTLINPLAYSVWDENLLTLTPEGEWRYGTLDAAQLKVSRILSLQQRFSNGLRKKFHLKCSYLDQYTCPPLWRQTDYDYRVNGAGKFQPVLKVFAKSLLNESRAFNGPVLSEGITQWMLSGFCDSYAQPSNPDQDLLLDFQLGKPHLLSNDCGYFLGLVASSKPEDVDKLLAMEIAYGNTGHLFGAECYGNAPPNQIKPELLKSYFMIQQLQQYYANIPVEMIRYNSDGKLLTIEEAIPTGALKNNQVYIKYQNGLEVYLNHNAGQNWNVVVSGKQYVLPPDGYVCLLPEKILEYSALVDGRRVDYVSGPQYAYCNGGGIEHDFGSIKAAYSYLIKHDRDALWVIPEPFTKKDIITLDLKKLAPTLAQAESIEILPVSSEGKREKAVLYKMSKDKNITFELDGSKFKYCIVGK